MLFSMLLDGFNFELSDIEVIHLIQLLDYQIIVQHQLLLEPFASFF